MGLLMNVLMAVTALNAVVLVAIAVAHIGLLKKTKSSFTIALLLFVGLLLLQNLFALYYFVTMMPLFVAGLEPYVLTYSVLQLFAFITLGWVTYR